MNGLFKATKKEPASASVFKFSFKLGGDEDLEDDAPTKKKNKNKKKKKKPSAGVADNDIANKVEGITSLEIGGPAYDEVDEMESLLKEVQISVEHQQNTSTGIDESATIVPVDEEKVLSKSQKKNLQKKKAKKNSELGMTEAASADCEVEAKVAASQTKKTNSKACSSKLKEAKPPSESDDEFAIPEPKVSKKNKPNKPEQQAKAKSTSAPTKPAGLAFAHLAASEPVSQQKGPHFISSKDPELDEASKLRFKYGMGRNLVAIGPAKVRDPNWLPPPPGLSRTSASPSMKSMPSKSIFPEKKPLITSAVAADATEEVHSSPFSFSFNGL